MPDVHCRLSPSSSHRWLTCTPSVEMESHFPNTTSEAAEQGTAAHSMGEAKIRHKVFHEDMTREPTSYDDEEMEECSDLYCNYVIQQIEEAKQFCKEPLVMIEQRLSFADIIPDGFGTADCIIATPKKLYITDYKHGRGVLVRVSDGLNPQLAIYAYGAYSNLRFLFPDVESVVMTIVQPRLDNIDSFEISIKELTEWAENTVKPRARMASKGEGELVVGEHCRFCRAKANCRARADEALALARKDFTVINGWRETSQGKVAEYQFKSPALLSQQEIEDVLPVLNRIQDWIDSVFTYVSSEAINHGRHWEGYKVVEGRSVRKYISDKMVEDACKQAGYTDIYEKAILPIKKLEKKLSKEVFKQLLVDKGLVIKPKGKLTLVPDSDKREEIDVSAYQNGTTEKPSAADDFSPIGK